MLWYRTWIGEVRVYLYIHIICVSIITMRKSNVIGNNINNYYHHYCCGCLFFFLSHFLYLFSLSFFFIFCSNASIWPSLTAFYAHIVVHLCCSFIAASFSTLHCFSFVFITTNVKMYRNEKKLFSFFFVPCFTFSRTLKLLYTRNIIIISTFVSGSSLEHSNDHRQIRRIWHTHTQTNRTSYAMAVDHRCFG